MKMNKKTTTTPPNKQSQICDHTKESTENSRKNATTTDANLQIIPRTGKIHVTNDNKTLVKEKILAGDISVWQVDKLPNRTKKFAWTTKKLSDLLIEYAETPQDVCSLLEKYHIPPMSFFGAVSLYSEIRERYAQAQKMKAHQYGKTALQTYEQLPEDPRLYTVDREGNSVLSSAGASYMRDKVNLHMRMAEIHEVGTYKQKKELDVTHSPQLHIHTAAKLTDLMGADPSELAQLLKAKTASI